MRSDRHLMMQIAWSKMLSDGWNHSDDEMYYCGYWGLYRYAFNDTLKAKYKACNH